MKRIFVSLLLLGGIAANAPAATCTPTGYFRDGINMTAALISPPGTVTGPLDATGCNIAVYYDSAGGGGMAKAADV